MKNFLQKSAVCNARQLLFLMGLFAISSFNRLHAQIPANAINADPAAKAITQTPLGALIVGNGVLKFRFTNEATSTNSTGEIPVGSVRLTISFPGNYAFVSVNDIPKFEVEDADTNPSGVVHLVNNALIQEGEVLDLLLNVRSVIAGSGTITFNTDRVTPIRVANMLTSNDNSSATFTTTMVLPVSLIDFTAQKQNCTAKLNWRTTGEKNIDNYVLEVSNNNGASYTAIQTIAANNSAGEKLYSSTYQMTNNNIYLYRIKINEISGSYTYSPIARIGSGCGNADNEVLVYPSPAQSNITLSVSNPALINSTASVVDVTGKIHMNFIITANTKSIKVDKLPAGIYMIRLNDGTSTRFMKQ